MRNAMKGKFHVGLMLLAAWAMTMSSCCKDNDNDEIPPSSGDTIEIADGCALRRGSIDPAVGEFSFHELTLFEKGINPNNFYITGYGELGTGWVLDLDCCCLNEEVAELERGRSRKRATTCLSPAPTPGTEAGKTNTCALGMFPSVCMRMTEGSSDISPIMAI